MQYVSLQAGLAVLLTITPDPHKPTDRADQASTSTDLFLRRVQSREALGSEDSLSQPMPEWYISPLISTLLPPLPIQL
jgi:hypothetical protein